MEKPLAAAFAGSKLEVYQRTGLVFATATLFPELAKVGVVQRFRSRDGQHVHEVRISELGELGCTCPGWRKYGKCWHVRWVLTYGIGENWTIGTFLSRIPRAVEAVEMTVNNGWAEWLEENVAVVEPAQGSAGPSTENHFVRRLPYRGPRPSVAVAGSERRPLRRSPRARVPARTWRLFP